MTADVACHDVHSTPNGAAFSAWIAALGTLPDDVRAVMAQQPPPATIVDADGDEAWSLIFRTWSQFAPTFDPMPLGNLNAFFAWASANWSPDQSWTIGAQPTVGEVREAYNTFFSGTESANGDLNTAMTQIAASTDADDADGTQLAQALAFGVQSAYAARYEDFRNDMVSFGPRIAQAGTLAEDASAEIRAENQRVIDSFPDRHYTDLRVVNWGGTVLVIIDDRHNLSKLGNPTYAYDGYIAKRSATIGVGEWVVDPDPGAWQEWIQYEIAQLGSKKPVVTGDAQKYDLWDG